MSNSAVIYARYSVLNESLEKLNNQISECKNVAKKHGLVIVEEYVDRGENTNDARPAFQRMLRDADRGAFDYIIVYSVDRFSRNKQDTENYIERLKQKGVKILFVEE